MVCAKCKAELPAGSSFCNKCGAAQAAAPAPPPAPAAPAAPSPDDAEEIVWQGRYSGWADAPQWFLWLLWVGALGYGYFALLKPEQRGGWVGYVGLGLAAAPALFLLLRTCVRKLTVRYKLTSHRFFRERGFISRQMDELELMRVDDVSVSQNILQRIFNVGVVTILSGDPSDPRLLVDGIENPIEVKEKIRTHVHKRRKGVVKMDHV